MKELIDSLVREATVRFGAPCHNPDAMAANFELRIKAFLNEKLGIVGRTAFDGDTDNRVLAEMAIRPSCDVGVS